MEKSKILSVPLVIPIFLGYCGGDCSLNKSNHIL